jgi:hypothetical protein
MAGCQWRPGNTIKDIMRHQDIRLTMDRYVRELDGAAKQAVKHDATIHQGKVSMKNLGILSLQILQ